MSPDHVLGLAIGLDFHSQSEDSGPMSPGRCGGRRPGARTRWSPAGTPGRAPDTWRSPAGCASSSSTGGYPCTSSCRPSASSRSRWARAGRRRPRPTGRCARAASPTPARARARGRPCPAAGTGMANAPWPRAPVPGIAGSAAPPTAGATSPAPPRGTAAGAGGLRGRARRAPAVPARARLRDAPGCRHCASWWPSGSPLAALPTSARRGARHRGAAHGLRLVLEAAAVARATG